MKRKGLIIFAALLILLGGIFCFREALIVRIFPKMVLSHAISQAAEQLENRFADSPVHLLTGSSGQAFDRNVHMKLDTSTKFMGIVHYDLNLTTQTGPNRITGEGSASYGGGLIPMKLYADEARIALSSDALTNGTWYGITYDSFPEDIRSVQLLGLILGDDILESWDASIADFAELMGRSYALPEIRVADLRDSLMGVLALKPQVTDLGGNHCYSITFTATGAELAETAQPHMNQLPGELAELIRVMKSDPESKLEVVCTLQTRQLTALEISAAYTGTTHEILVRLEENNRILAELLELDGQNLTRSELMLDTQSDSQTYQEAITLRRTHNGVQTNLSADYTWDLSTGDMDLEIVKGSQKYPIRLNLKGEDNGFTATCQCFEVVLSLLSGKENPRPAICTLTVSPGIEVPELGEYRNLSDWSIEDFYLLLTRIGGLVGIKIP